MKKAIAFILVILLTIPYITVWAEEEPFSVESIPLAELSNEELLSIIQAAQQELDQRNVPTATPEPTATPKPTATAKPVTKVKINEGKNPNIRSEPSTEGKILGNAKSGQVYELLDTSGNWYKIRLANGKEGWIAKSMATVTNKGSITIVSSSSSTKKPSGKATSKPTAKPTAKATRKPAAKATAKPAESLDFSGLIVFKSKMMRSVSSQINSATDLTTTGTNRAVLAALLTLEFAAQRPDCTIDYTKPIYVGKSGTMASVMFCTSKGYVLVIYQMNPLSTSYGIVNEKNAAVAKASLALVSDDVWEVPLDLYTEKLTLLVDQL